MTTTDKPTKQTTLFRRAAREHEADVSPERFDAALKVVGQHNPKDKPPVLRPVRRGQPKAG